MDPRLLTHYERELRHVREMGAEFARDFPKIAGRLGLEGLECADPYVERLIEAFGFLAARVQLRIEDEFPRFTQHMLELAYPHYLAPTPSMAVVQFRPSAREGGLASGFTIERDSALRGRVGKGEQTACEYRTSHPVQLWPLEIRRAEYTTQLTELSAVGLPDARKAQAMLRVRLATTAGVRFEQLALDRLPLFLNGNDDVAMALYEQFVSASLSTLCRVEPRSRNFEPIAPEGLVPLGFDDDEAMLPYGPRSFQGYRLLHEYFAFPSRYMFVELRGLNPAVRRCKGNELELLFLFERAHPLLEGVVDASRLLLFCTPAINLFPRQADRIHVSSHDSEHHVVPDRTRPMDLEVHSVTRVLGYGSQANRPHEYAPLYAARARDIESPEYYYTCSRVPRTLSARQQLVGARSTYIGSEVFLTLTLPGQAGLGTDVRQLGVSTLCTNRDLPLHMPVGQGPTDFTLQAGAPTESIRCVAGPSVPRASIAQGDMAWRLLSHLSLNYLTLIDTDQQKGAAALRELLSLYAAPGDGNARKQIAGMSAIRSAPAIRPTPGPGPIAFGRGLEVTLECDETAFQGSGVFLMASVLERFFAKYTAINSFTETVLRTAQRGEVMRWPTTNGQRPTL